MSAVSSDSSLPSAALSAYLVAYLESSFATIWACSCACFRANLTWERSTASGDAMVYVRRVKSGGVNQTVSVKTGKKLSKPEIRWVLSNSTASLACGPGEVHGPRGIQGMRALRLVAMACCKEASTQAWLGLHSALALDMAASCRLLSGRIRACSVCTTQISGRQTGSCHPCHATARTFWRNVAKLPKNPISILLWLCAPCSQFEFCTSPLPSLWLLLTALS